MSPNSHVVQWLSSVYRRVLRRQRVDQVRHSPEALMLAGDYRRAVESLEPRVLLSTVTLVDTPLADYTSDPRLRAGMQGVLQNGIEHLADQINATSTSGDFTTDVPGVLKYQTFGQAPTAANLLEMLGGVNGTTLGELIKSEVAAPIGSVADGSQISALELSNDNFASLGDVHWSVAVTDAQLNPDAGSNYKLTVHVSFTITDDSSDNLYFDLGRNADQLGIRSTQPNVYVPAFGDAVNVKAGLTVDFTAGLDVGITDLGGGAGDASIHDTQINVAGNPAFFETGGSIAANASIDTAAQGINPTASAEQLGFLDVDLTLASFTLDGHITLNLLDGASSGSTIYFDDLDSLTHSAPAVTGAIASEVDISVDNVGHFADNFLAGPHDYQVNFTGTPLGASVSSIPGSGDHRTAPAVSLNGNADSGLEPYNHVSAGAVVGMLKSYAEKLGTMPASSVLNSNLALSTGTTLGDLIPLGTLISDHLIFDQTAGTAAAGAKLVDSNGAPVFTSAQTLVDTLASVLGTSIGDINAHLVNDGTHNELVYTIGMDLANAPLPLSTSQASINLNLDELEPVAGLTSTAKVTLTPTGRVDFTFGIDVSAPGSNPIVISPAIANTRIVGVVNGSGSVQTPSNGQLPGDAVFKLSVGGSPNGNSSFAGGVATVRLSAATTSGNSTVAQLASQLQTAVNNALNVLDLDPSDPTHTHHLLSNPVSEPIPGHLLVQVGALADGRLTLSSPFTSFLKLAVVTPDDQGGFASLGFVNNQTGLIAPTPYNGKLSGDATFNLRLGIGSPLIPVTLLQSQTLGNTSINDLLTELTAKVTSATGSKVHAELLPGNAGAIILVVDDASVRSLQIVDPSPAVVSDLGWQDQQIAAEIQTAGRNELDATAGTFPTIDGDGNPGTDFSFDVTIDGLGPVTVTVLQNQVPRNPSDPSAAFNLSNTAGNASVSDLATDINQAFGLLRLSDGRLLGTLISATAIDTNHDGESRADTIQFRSTADVQSFHIAPGANASSIGLTSAIDGARVGPGASGDLGSASAATFTITVGSQDPQVITITSADTADNAASADPIAALAKDIQSKITGPLADHIVVGRSGNHLVITAPDVADQLVRITLDESTPQGQAARDLLGLQDDQVGRSAGNVDYFVDNASVHLGVTVSVNNATASGHVGFVGIDVGDIDANAALDLNLQLQNNQTGDSRISISKLDGRLTDITVTGTSAIPDGSLGGAQSFKLKVNGGAEVTVNVADGATTRNGVIQHVQQALDAALAAAGVNARVLATQGSNGKLVLSVSSLQAAQFEITAGNPILGLVASGPQYSLLHPATVSWSGTLDVQGITVHTPIPGLNPSIPDLHLNAGNALPGLATFIPTVPILSSLPQDLKDFANLVFDNPLAATGQRIVDAIGDLGSFFNGNFNSLPFLGTKIPVINKSLADLLNLSDSFQKVVDAFKANPTDTVQGLRNRLIEALNLPSDSSDDPGDPVHVTYDAATHSLLLDLTFAKTFTETLPIDFNLNLPFDLKGNAALEVDGGATAKLGIGVDLSDPLHPVFFLNTDPTDTTFGLTFAARGSGMSFNLSFGPAGLFINDGQLAIDGDGNPMTKTDPLSFDVTISDNDGTPNNRVSFADIFSNINNISIQHNAVTGQLNGTLPVFFPTDSDFLGNLGIQITDLGAFLTGDTSSLTISGEDVIENLASNISNFSLLDNLPMMIDGVDFVLAKIQSGLDGSLGSVNLPLVGSGLHDASQFIANLRSSVFEKLRSEFTGAVQKTADVITNALTDAFSSLGVLDGAVVPTEQINGNSNDFVEWRFSLGQSFSIGTPFDLGLPVLGLSSKDPITLGMNWHANLGFGIDFTHGFYFIVNDAPNTPELTAGVTVDLPSTVEGNLLFFKLTATDKHPGHDLTANVGLDFSGGDDGKVGLGDLGSMDVSPSLTGSADIDLHLKAGINGGGVVSDKVIAALPSIVADLNLGATLTLPAPDGKDAFSLDHVSLDNIGLDLGSFFTDFLSPMVKGIQDVTKPLQPFIDVFTSPIPVISDLAGQPVTLLDVASLFGDVDPGMLDAVAKIVTLVNSIPDPSTVGDLIIPFGSVTLVGGSSGSDVNLFDTHALDSVRDPSTPLSGRFGDAVDSFTSGGGFDGAIGHAMDSNGNPQSVDPSVSSFATGLGDKSIADFIDFPILNDPSQIIGALFGRPFTIVTLDLPPFSFGFTYSQFFPIVGPLGASITGSLGAKFDFAFGYDSYGLQKFAEGGFEHPLDIFRGFYVSDTANADGTGADVNEVEITGSLVGSAELNLGVASASVGGGVKVTFGLNLHDPNNDGKVRIEELVDDILYSDPGPDPLGIFDLNVKVEAFLTWAVEVLFVFKASGQIGPSLPLLDLTFDSPHKSILATDVGDHVLRLNTGPFAGDRMNNDVSDGDETMTVTQVSPGHYHISGFGETDQDYDGDFTKIEAYGGQGNDHFIFNGVTIPVVVDGGQGDDTIDFSNSSGQLTATGGTGNDSIFGGAGNDIINGNDGQDLIIGGGGNDLLHGDAGNDIVSGDGNDTIFGDDGNDKLAGGPDGDYISGGTGDDEIWGDATFDTSGTFHAATTDGNDTISGDDGRDALHGDGGDDKIAGGAAADLIEGNLGADTIYGDSTYAFDASSGTSTLTSPLPQTSGNDTIYGDSQSALLTGPGADGGDSIHGEAGNDFVRGNSGNDSVFGDDGNDILFGDQDQDHIEAGDGGDIVFGGADNDTVLGQAGSDILFGDDGLVVYYNFPAFTGVQGDQMNGANRLIGDGDPSRVSEGVADSDPLSRDLAITDVRTTDGNDYVNGAAGNDAAFGGKGDDTVIGDDDPTSPGFDPSTSPAGNDLLFGDGGKVQWSGHILSVAATVAPFDDGGNDTLYGNNGDDIGFGGPGNDQINGGHGASFVTAGSDKDILIGDNGEVDFTSGKRTLVFTTNEGVGGVDLINGNEDDDIAMGGAAGDSINGNTGNDVLIGDEGRVEFTTDSLHVTLIKTTDTIESGGGIDNINGNTGQDIILGGVQGDVLSGNEDKDILVGDEGQLSYNLAGLFDGDVTTLDKIETTSFTLGGNDQIAGNQDSDIALGGSGADSINGNTGNDSLVGDQGEVDFFAANVTRIITTDTADSDGGADLVNGNEDNDVILGGVLGDSLNGNDGSDIVLGDEGQLQYSLTGGQNQDGNPLTLDNIETLQPSLGGSDIIQGNASGDIAFGGAAGDFVYGDADSPAAAQDAGDTLLGDGGRVSLVNGVVWKIESTDTAIGGSDYIEGNAGSDIMLGGALGDEMHGDAGNTADLNPALDGNDIMLGDNGLLNWLYQGNAAFASTIEAGLNFAVVGADITTLDLITTTAPNDGGNDSIFGNAGSDILFGGTAADLVVGDNTKAAAAPLQDGPASARPGSDLEFGDHGRLYPQHSFLPTFPSRNFFSIDIGFASGGAGDQMFGNEADDIMIGGQGDDQMFGNSGDDDMIGGHNVSTTTGSDKAIDELAQPTPTSVNDLMDGGTGDDAIAGDNAIIWRNGSALQPNDLRYRIRTLGGALLYNPDGSPTFPPPATTTPSPPPPARSSSSTTPPPSNPPTPPASPAPATAMTSSRATPTTTPSSASLAAT